MRILFIGDVVGRTGRNAIETYVPQLKNEYTPDVTIVNGENSAHGKGISENICVKFWDLGVDCITLGNHAWAQRQIITYIDGEERLVRPMNFPKDTPGKGYYIHNFGRGRKILILNVMGRTFMEPLDNPFAVTEEFLKKYRLRQNIDAIFIDFHAEATSEKMAFAHCFDGRVSAVIGTHTHVPTSDEQILPHGTGYQTDTGMTGDYDSVLGVKKEVPIQRFVRQMPTEKFTPAEGESTLCGCLITLDDNTGLTTDIQRIQVGGRLKQVKPVF